MRLEPALPEPFTPPQPLIRAAPRSQAASFSERGCFPDIPPIRTRSPSPAPDTPKLPVVQPEVPESSNPRLPRLIPAARSKTVGEEGVDRDYAKAFEWLNRCEEAGSLQSASKLGYLYMKGEGCTADENKAKELFERAAQTECDGYALYELGFIYERKNESPEDLERAAQCYQKAIEMGNESASRRFSHFKKGLFGRWKITY